MRCRSTGSVTLKLYIPQIPHINFPFVVASFDDYAAVPEVCLDVYDGLLTFEDSLAGIAEGVGIHRQQTAEVAVFHSHPKELNAHHAIDEMKIAVLDRRYRHVIVIPVSDHRSERVPCIGTQSSAMHRRSARNLEGHHG